MNENRKVMKVAAGHLIHDNPCPICDSEQGYFKVGFRRTMYECKNLKCKAQFWESKFDDSIFYYVRK